MGPNEVKGPAPPPVLSKAKRAHQPKVSANSNSGKYPGSTNFHSHTTKQPLEFAVMTTEGTFYSMKNEDQNLPPGISED